MTQKRRITIEGVDQLSGEGECQGISGKITAAEIALKISPRIDDRYFYFAKGVMNPEEDGDSALRLDPTKTEICQFLWGECGDEIDIV
jgi:hypothetical protein